MTGLMTCHRFVTVLCSGTARRAPYEPLTIFLDNLTMPFYTRTPRRVFPNRINVPGRWGRARPLNILYPSFLYTRCDFLTSE
jgi:hypothetical protein